MKKIYLWLLLPLLIFGGCESLEDTYKDYAGDGPIRYLVKCQSRLESFGSFVEICG